jgi:hypothetical protein
VYNLAGNAQTASLLEAVMNETRAFGSDSKVRSSRPGGNSGANSQVGDLESNPDRKARFLRKVAKALYITEIGLFSFSATAIATAQGDQPTAAQVQPEEEAEVPSISQ